MDYKITAKNVNLFYGAKQALFLPVNQIVVEGEYSCLMVTGNNRVPVWDVRHRASDPRCINRIDHLDVFRGNRVEADLSLAQIAKLKARRLMRFIGKVR
jgi:hypothetical protein